MCVSVLYLYRTNYLAGFVLVLGKVSYLLVSTGRCGSVLYLYSTNSLVVFVLVLGKVSYLMLISFGFCVMQCFNDYLAGFVLALGKVSYLSLIRAGYGFFFMQYRIKASLFSVRIRKVKSRRK